MGTRRRWLLVCMMCTAIGAGACVTLGAARYYPAYRNALEARDDLRSAQTLLRERHLDTNERDLAQAEAQLDQAEDGLRSARGRFDDPLMRAGSHIPLVGESIDSSVELADLGLDGVALGRDVIVAARTYRELREGDTRALAQRMDVVFAQLDPSMSAIATRIDRMRERRDALRASTLPPAMQRAVAELDGDLEELDELAATYDSLSEFVPEFLGFSGRRTYLVLAQNNAELMATGGLISVYGSLSFEDGRVVERRFADAIAQGAASTVSGGRYVEPPGPLGRYLLHGQSWNLSLSNWSPDFPTSASEAERFHTLAGGSAVDGVIAINVHTIEALLGVTGPVAVPGYDVSVSAKNALDVIEEHTRQATAGGRKTFVGVLAEELIVRLSELPSDRWTALVDTLQRLRDERQLLLSSHGARQQALGRELGIDGALEDAPGDYLMVVDASVNSTKLNIALRQQIGIEVHLDRTGAAQHKTAIDYFNGLPFWAEGRDPALVSQLMLGGVYGGYVRLLAPGDSALQSVAMDGVEAGVEEITSEGEKASFGRFFSLPSGTATELTYRHSVAGVVENEDSVSEYRLYLQKQSGTSAIPVTLAVRLPDGATLLSATLDGSPLPRLNAFSTELSRDREIVVRYRLEKE
ncbi:MAG: DUF4012 domain-containing protein [Dehalococcoidia bacterium]